MKVTATKPWDLIHIDISYIEPNYKSERYQLTATCMSAINSQYESLFQGGTAVAERANQILATIVRCLKLAGNFPDRAVSELCDTAAHYHNRLPHGRTGNETTPYELLHNKKPTSHWLYSLRPPAWRNSSQEARLLRLKMLPLLRTFLTYEK